MGRKEKVDSGTRVTPLTEGTSQYYGLDLPMLPDEPWDPVEYDPDMHNDTDMDDDFIDVNRLQNLLADPSEKHDVAVIDTRDYNDFLASRLVFAQHIDEFLNEEAQILIDKCEMYSIFVLYDNNGRTLSLMNSPLSRMYDFLKSNSFCKRLFIIDGGFESVVSAAQHLVCKSVKTTRRYDLCPSVCENVLWGNSEDFNVAQVVKHYGVSHIVTFEANVAPKTHFGVESLLLKIDPDSLKLFDHFEELFKFLLLGKSEDHRPTKLLLTCSNADNRCSAAVIAYMMFRHHWNLDNAFTHVVKCRKAIQLGKNNFKALQKLEKRLFGKLITKSMPKLKLAKKEDDERVEDKASDTESSVSVKKVEKKKKKKRKVKTPRGTDSDSDLKFSDEERNEKKTKKSKKKKESNVLESPGTPEVTPRRNPFKKKRPPSAVSKEAEEKEKRSSRTKGSRKSTTESVEPKEVNPLDDPRDQDPGEEQVVQIPQPKKRSGLMKLKKNASEGLEASATVNL